MAFYLVINRETGKIVPKSKKSIGYSRRGAARIAAINLNDKVESERYSIMSFGIEEEGDTE